MISRAHRFHGYGSLRYVYQHGQTVRGPLTAVRYTPNTHRPSYRLAVVVSKKVNKSAVARNRMRRRLYEAVRAEAAAIERPYDIVITVFHDELLSLTPQKLGQLVHAQLKQAGILGNKTTPPHAKI